MGLRENVWQMDYDLFKKVRKKKVLSHTTMFFKGALSGLKQVFPTENSLKIMKNGFCFTLKAFFVLKIFKFLSCLFGHLVKQLY